MKKFTLISASILTAIAASAAAPMEAVSLTGTPFQIDSKTLLAPAREAIDPANPPKPVTSKPEGEATLMSRECIGYSFITGQAIETKDFGMVAETVKDEDGNMWFSSNVSQMTTNSWIKAEPNADGTKYTMQLPQPVFTQQNGADLVTYYLVRMAYNPDRSTFTPTDDQTFTFALSKDGKLEAEGRDLLGVAVYLQQTDADGKPTDTYGFSWTGYGDYGIIYTPQTAKTLEPPKGMTIEPWGLMSAVEGHEVYVGIDTERENIWVQGVLPALPYAWTKGDIMPDGTVQFVSDQYQGADSSTGHFAFFCGSHTERKMDITGYMRDVIIIDRQLDMQYDPEKKKLWAENANLLMTSTSIEASTVGIAYTYIIKNPVLKLQNHVKGTPPMHPEFTSILPYTSDGMYGGFACDIPTIDVDYNMIDSRSMYWEMFVDDELYTFYTDEYPHLPQSTSRLPFNYGDGYDIMTQGVDHVVYFFFEGAETIGVQSILVEGDLETRSAMQIWDFETAEQFTAGVNKIEVDSDCERTPAATEYYDMTGRRLASPSGICIRVTRYTDGSSKAQKVAVRTNR